MNKKGFTLVELMAVIVLLAVVALIAVPNVLKSINKYRQGLYDTQIQNIVSASKNWAADQIDSRGCLICVADTNEKDKNMNCESNPIAYDYCVEAEQGSSASTSVTVGSLMDNGYLDDDLKNPLNDDPFNRNDQVIVMIDQNTGDYIYSYQEFKK